MKYKNLMAKALYDNVPEAPEELAFRKGDILVVIEQNTGGLEGWWLCSLHGRQGIAPGNRLKLLLGPTIEGSTGPSHSLAQQQSPYPHQGIYQVPPLHQSSQGKDQPIYQVPPTQDVYQVPQRSTLADGMPSRVVTPTRSGQAYTFGPAHSPALSPANSLYDVPSLQSQGVYDIPPIKQVGKSSHGQSSDIPPSQVVHIQGVYDVLPPSREYSLPPCGGGAALEESSYDVPQTHRQKPEDVYDVPPAFLSKSPQCSQSTQSNYDFPPSSEPCVATSNDSSNSIYDVPSSQPPATGSHDLYDIPRGFQRVRDRGRGIYDAPAADVRALADVMDGVSCLSFSSTGSSMSTSSSSAGSPAEGCLKASNSALARLGRLTQALDSSVSALQHLVCSLPESRAGERRAVLERICGALADLLALGRGSALSDTALLRRLEEAQMVLQQAQGGLDGGTPAIRLHRALTVSRAMLDDARQLVSTIGGSAELLFRRAPVEGIVHPFTCSPPDQDKHSKDKAFPVEQDRERCVTSWMEDYDYVHLQGKEEFERQQKELLEKENIVKQSRMHLGQDQDCDQDQLIQFKKLEQEVTKPVENDITQWISHQHSTGSSSPSDSSSVSSGGGGVHLCGRDRQLLLFYAEQYEQHFVTLLNTIDAFFGCVAGGQPPRIFVAHAKFVILSAHKLVFIGDTLSRQASSPDVANRVMDSSNMLCDLLKTVVGSTKMAALHYPHTAAVQDMVDRVTLLSHQAQQLKVQLVHMASF